GRIKKDARITVILGNPPWSGESANRGIGIDEGYDAECHRIDGERLGEKNLKWLRDDYVKFLRLAQRKIDEAGEGIVALVTSHGYLDKPHLRAMRRPHLAL